MKNDNIKLWNVFEEFTEELFVDFIEDQGDGLVVCMSAGIGKPRLKISFGNSVLSFQSTTEICVLKYLDDFPKLNTRWQFFLTTDSEYTDWLDKQSYGVVNTDSKVHYIIKHPEGLIHIVATLEPSIEWQYD